MLTVSDDDADLFAALRAGAHGYLLKTMNLRRLPDALEGVLSVRRPCPVHWSRTCSSSSAGMSPAGGSRSPIAAWASG